VVAVRASFDRKKESSALKAPRQEPMRGAAEGALILTFLDLREASDVHLEGLTVHGVTTLEQALSALRQAS
jgi:hypothetical protein